MSLDDARNAVECPSLSAGTKSTLHLHHDSDEVAYYVLSGEVTFMIGDEVTVGGPRRATCLEEHRSGGRMVVFLYTPGKAGGFIEEQQRTGRKLSSINATKRAEFCQRHG